MCLLEQHGRDTGADDDRELRCLTLGDRRGGDRRDPRHPDVGDPGPGLSGAAGKMGRLGLGRGTPPNPRPRKSADPRSLIRPTP